MVIRNCSSHEYCMELREDSSSAEFPGPRLWGHTFNLRRFTSDLEFINNQVLYDMQELSSIPHIYTALYHRTRTFTATVRNLVDTAPAMWAEAACLLVDWSVHVLRRKEFGLERFLPSQRGSLYYTLDDALLRICVDQWDPPEPTKSPTAQSHTSTSSFSKVAPWDEASEPIRLALSKGQELLPSWGELELKHWGWDGKAEWFEAGWFRRSRKFLEESNRIYEIWRTMSRWGEGQLPAELAHVIVEDVASSENLPMGELRAIYFPK